MLGNLDADSRGGKREVSDLLTNYSRQIMGEITTVIFSRWVVWIWSQAIWVIWEPLPVPAVTVKLDIYTHALHMRITHA
jgi:hypothetical protein